MTRERYNQLIKHESAWEMYREMQGKRKFTNELCNKICSLEGKGITCTVNVEYCMLKKYSESEAIKIIQEAKEKLDTEG